MIQQQNQRLDLSTPLTQTPRRTNRNFYSWRQTIRVLVCGTAGGAVVWLYATHDTFWSGVAAVALTIVACRAMRGGINEPYDE